MRTIATILALIAVALPALPSLAQGEVPAFCLATDPADPDYDIADYEPVRDADDWCKLAYHQPHKARRQLAKAVALVRSQNNPNRYYFDPKHGSPAGLYIQLLRPWMVEQNAAGTHDWRVRQSSITTRSHLEYYLVIENTLADNHYLGVEVSPRSEHDRYRLTSGQFRYNNGELLATYCSLRETVPEDHILTAAEVKREVEYVLGNADGHNCS